MTAPVLPSCIHVNLGRMEYRSCLDLQHRTLALRQQNLIPDCLLIVEHPSVFTMGRSGRRDNLLVPEAVLDEWGISCVDIERGGDITYHGPGQLVVYPIFKLTGRIGVADFITNLEDMMLELLQRNDIDGQRCSKNRGVWVGESKIGFVGIAVRRGVSTHGMALNVSPDLSFFSMINPCGLTRTPISSMGRLVRGGVELSRVAAQIQEIAERMFNYRSTSMDPDSFNRFLDMHDR